MAFFPTNAVVAAGMTADREGAFRNQQAQMAARAAVEQARIQAQTQQAALQQQAMQRDQANQLAQQAQAENAFFNRGRLTNEQAKIAADLKLAQIQQASLDAWRTAQLGPKNAVVTADNAERDRADKEFADSINNFANLMTEAEVLKKKNAELEKAKVDLAEMTTVRDSPGEASRALSNFPLGGPVGVAVDYFKNSGARKERAAAAPKIGDMPYDLPINPDAPLDLNLKSIATAQAAVQAQLADLNSLLGPLQKQGLAQHLKKEGDRWVPTVQTPALGQGQPAAVAPVAGAPFFNRTPTTTTTTTSRGPIDQATAMTYLQKAGNNPAEARRLAALDGWEIQ